MSELSATRTEADEETEMESYAPTALWLETMLPKVGGGYTKVMGQTWNGAPLWQSERGYWLYQKISGAWAVCVNRSDMRADKDVGITSTATSGADDEHSVIDAARRMPHTIEKWYLKGREDSGTHVTANPNREVTVQQLLVFLVNDNMKCRHYKHLPFYAFFVFFITFTSSLLPNGLYGDHHNSEYWVEEGIRARIDAESLLAVDTDDKMWEWIDGALGQLWANKIGATTNVTANETLGQYFETTLVADQGRTLLNRAVDSSEECKRLCDATPGCLSFTFSNQCRSCMVNDKCVNPFEARTQPSPACNDLRTFYRPCPSNNPAPTPGTVNQCDPNGVTYNMECTGVVGTSSFGCTSTTPAAPAPAENTEESIIGRFNFALGYVLLRQFRVERSACPASANAIPPAQRVALPVECSGRWSNGAASSQPYGNNRRFVADDDVTHAFGGPTVRTAFSEFSEMGKRYTIPLALGDDLQSVKSTVSGLRNDYAWFDPQTRLVYLEAVLFIPNAEGLYVYVSGYVEYMESGVVKPGISIYAFSILNLESDRYRAMFAFDILVLASVLLLIASFMRTLVHNYRQYRAAGNPNIRYIGLWDWFDLIHIAICIAAMYFRWWLWHNGRVLSQDNFYDEFRGDVGGDESKLMFNWLSQYSQWYDWQNNYLAAAIILSYLRLFKYVQFNQRLNKLSETVKGAFADLIGMVVIFLIVLFAFSLGGCLMYGATIVQFRKFSEALSFLVRVLFTADMEERWDDMVALRPSSTWLFLALFFLISWLLLLNMVLAIIAGSFAMVQESLTRKSSWTFTDLIDDIRKYIRRFMCRKYQNDETGARQGSAGGGLTYAPVEVILGIDPQGVRYTSILTLCREWADKEKDRLRRQRPDLTESMLEDSRLFITALQFRTVCRMVDPPLTSSKEIDRLFSSAQGQVVSGQNNSALSQDRKFGEIGDRIDMLEKKIETAAAVRQQISSKNLDAVEHTNRDIVEKVDDRVDQLAELLKALTEKVDSIKELAARGEHFDADRDRGVDVPKQLRSPPRPRMSPELVSTMRAAGATALDAAPPLPRETPPVPPQPALPTQDEIDARRRGMPPPPADPPGLSGASDEEGWPALMQALPATALGSPTATSPGGVVRIEPFSDSSDDPERDVPPASATVNPLGAADLQRPPSFRKNPFDDGSRVRRSLQLNPPARRDSLTAGNPLRIGSAVNARATQRGGHVPPPGPRGLTTPSVAAAGLRPDPRGQDNVFIAPDGSRVVAT